MTYLIKELPLEERPRERFKNYGVESLSDEELISIILRTGSKKESVKDLSTNILRQYTINELNNIDYHALIKVKGIGEVKAITLLSAIELGKRTLKHQRFNVQIKSSLDVYNYVKEEMEFALQEKLLVLFLNTRKFVISKKVIFIGTVNSSTVHPRDVFREAINTNAVSIILIHNHPAGSTNPSMQDVVMTNAFIKVGHITEIEVLDHIIIGNDGYYSFLENNKELFSK